MACCLMVLACCMACSGAEDVAAPGVQLSDTEIIVSPTLDDVREATRAFVHDNSNLPSDRMRLRTYYSESNTEYFQSDLLFENDLWTFYGDNIKGRKYFWPVNGRLTFFAHFPNELAGTGMAYAFTAGTPRLTYTGTSPITEAAQQDMKELIFAYSRDCSPTNNGRVDLTFHRPFSLVVFRLNESIRCTIQSVKITGIQNNGTATCNTTAPWATWTPTGAATNIEVDYSVKPEYSTNNGIRYPQDINSDADLAQPFLVVPQTLPDEALIEITYAAEGSPRFSTAKSKLNKAMLAGSTTEVSEWQPGNKYVYSLTLNGAADEIFVAVKVMDWIIEGESETDVH